MRMDLIDPHVYLHAVPTSWRGAINEASQNMGGVFSWSYESSWYEADPGPADCGSLITCVFSLKTTEQTKCFFAKNGELSVDCGPLAPTGWKWTDRTDPACFGGSFARADVQMLGDTVPVLEIPLVDREE